jgi:hypothetical protein
MTSTAETTFWEEVQSVAEEYEQKGWLHKFFDVRGVEYWDLTVLGRRELGLPQRSLNQKRADAMRRAARGSTG